MRLRFILFIVYTNRRFAPNVSDVSDEFQRLAVQFNSSGMSEYSALCYLGASKCEKALNNSVFEMNLLMKAARAFIEADRNRICLRSNAKQHLQGAINCYNSALMELDNNSVIKAAIIRELKKIHPNCDITSNFVSPAHRVHDLDLAATECIKNGNFEFAFDKITEICDDICERKVEHLYEDVLRKHEITLILLILLLDLPSARQSPSNIKLYEYFINGADQYDDKFNQKHSLCIMNAIQSLIIACKCRQYNTVVENEIPSVAIIPGLTLCQQILLEKLNEKYTKLL